MTRFHRLMGLSVFLVFSLIFIGGLVRSTGAGMGCPDWPKCFGSWVPPVSEAQLPADYQIRYQDHGYGDMRFNVVKTWTEYVNRLFGVLVGFSVLASWIASLSLYSSRPRLFWVATASLVLVIAQGGLGAMVVYSNLLPNLVTIHMAVAFVIILMLLYCWIGSASWSLTCTDRDSARLKRWFGIALGVVFVQVVLGTQVRELVDVLLNPAYGVARDQWITYLDELPFYLHRSFSWIVVAIVLRLLLLMRKSVESTPVSRLVMGSIGGSLAVSVLLGIVMVYAAFPAWAQPLHLLVASSLFCGLSSGLLLLKRTS